jgi:hypothetical protein
MKTAHHIKEAYTTMYRSQCSLYSDWSWADWLRNPSSSPGRVKNFLFMWTRYFLLLWNPDLHLSINKEVTGSVHDLICNFLLSRLLSFFLYYIMKFGRWFLCQSCNIELILTYPVELNRVNRKDNENKSARNSVCVVFVLIVNIFTTVFEYVQRMHMGDFKYSIPNPVTG